MSYVTPRSVLRLEDEIAAMEAELGVVTQGEGLEDEAPPVETEPEPEREVVAESPEEETFKKRYSDLRRLQQKTSDENKKLAADLAEAKKQTPQAGLPSAEEVAEWTKTNPKAAAILKAIFMEQMSPNSKEVSEIKAQLKRAEQEALISKAHPDFAEIVEADEFQDWADEQPEGVQQLIFSSSAKDVIWAVGQFKKEHAVPPNPNKEAAKAVSKSSSSAPESRTKGRFSESQVQKMSMPEYEKNEAAITKSQQDGTFVYDLSGAAR
jgi:hypothetical protein